MAVNDTFVGIIEFDSGPVAEVQSGLEISRLNLDSLKTRIANQRLSKNGSSDDLDQLYLAMAALRPAYVRHYIKNNKTY